MQYSPCGTSLSIQLFQAVYMYTALFVYLITPFLVVYRLSQGQLDAALRHSFPRQRSEELANRFEEFFLHNADEITELIKRSQRSSNSTHLYSQQMVCSLVQVYKQSLI